ncbi:hypothetical protein GNI_075180 [Gregarina niphandrodes]|uniref:Uncharacterized protein n=1 Tax=Gregarina niphandrodes TaxID=110365 RepID=A0A023B6W4_GRENI|nr:hypothetical protein GNI_075180 [Gregarina niphandrodes]EZG66828.1 hypothetical protein GNI_075180 [Gregarina niphandrodes]|eukprot:XP_011130471.1 hypothetical protein GNI_075180 [Gregarina niphandrodes]
MAETFQEWLDSQSRLLLQEEAGTELDLYELLRLEYPFLNPEALGLPAVESWPALEAEKVANIPIKYDGQVAVTVIILEAIPANLINNAPPDCLFFAVADNSASTLLTIATAKTPVDTKLLKRGTVIHATNLRSTALQGVGTLVLTKRSTVKILGHDIMPFAMNFAPRDGQKGAY